MGSGHGTDIDGIEYFALELARSCTDYPKEVFAKLAEIEDGHVWFRSRDAAIGHPVKKYLNINSAHCRFLEIGCGSG